MSAENRAFAKKVNVFGQEIVIDPELLKFYNGDLEWVAESGLFQVFIGPNSRDVKAISFEYK